MIFEYNLYRAHKILASYYFWVYDDEIIHNSQFAPASAAWEAFA